MRILITGHVGFIGSHFVKYLLQGRGSRLTQGSVTTRKINWVEPDVQVTGFSRHSDTRNLQRLGDKANQYAYDQSRLRSVWGDLTDKQALSGICERIDVVVNFAAKTFVDHSLKDRQPFIQSNIIGADNLMEDATRYGVKCFVQVSTDEVYGQILEGSYKEDALLQPRNPYSWSKACADLNAIQRHRTYGFPCIITRTENNFGSWQHRQKVLPTFVRAALADQPLPVYGDGQHVRCWLHVEEHCRAIWHLVKCALSRVPYVLDATADEPHSLEGRHLFGQVFHIAGEEELTNLALAKIVLRTLGKPEDRIKFIEDRDIRPGHDRRYALDCSKLRTTGFEISQNLYERLEETIRWYADHPEWTA